MCQLTLEKTDSKNLRKLSESPSRGVAELSGFGFYANVLLNPSRWRTGGPCHFCKVNPRSDANNHDLWTRTQQWWWLRQPGLMCQAPLTGRCFFPLKTILLLLFVCMYVPQATCIEETFQSWFSFPPSCGFQGLKSAISECFSPLSYFPGSLSLLFLPRNFSVLGLCVEDGMCTRKHTWRTACAHVKIHGGCFVIPYIINIS